ncbi:CBS domain-containing protein [Mangrovibacillus cuniculi]|uniref:CBS domain-containing protein n=1 Tax=Mangrovibacillus cuniculi TaxID=2593652 RepID=A0A7S8CB40_9BACI|nr:CBS domain-containing protein [Mangrovibacillus cuniculi]QPC46727.1 CBS domain-containing protein [Mangrovibacillus cuniculi]
MFVKNLLIPKHKVFSLQLGQSLEEAMNMLESKEVDALPVLDKQKYVGVVTRYNIYKGLFDSGEEKETFLKKTDLTEVLSHQDKYLEGNEVFEQTLVELKDFPLLAVVDEKLNFLGVVTRFDVMEQFQSAFGVHRKGIRIAFTSVETEGRIARLAEIIQQYHESVISLVTFDETDKLVRRIVLKIEKKDNIDKFITKLEKSGFRVLDIVED